MTDTTYYGPRPDGPGDCQHNLPVEDCTAPACFGKPAITHQGLSPDGRPADHRGERGLCQAPECRASGAIALALTIQQPYADAIIQPAESYRTPKGTENRTWPIPPKYEGLRILIHAGLAAARNVVLPPDADIARRNWPDQRGVILGTARITSCHQATTAGPLCCTPWGFPNTDHAMWHWRLADVWALPMPVKARGSQKLWRPARSLVAAVREQETREAGR